jgi:hypothetical protein
MGDPVGVPFEPDWCLAPAATLNDWMDENSISASMIAAASSRRDDPDRRREALRMVREVLDRAPLTEAHATVLERGTQVPARIWLALENNYRAGLAAGLRDVT